MAGPSTFLFVLVLSMPTLLALANTPYPDNTPSPSNTPYPYCDRPCQSELSLHLYLHQFVAGPNHPNRNEEFVITTNYPFNFGTTLIHDWSLTETVSPSSTVVARAQGTHIQASRSRTDGWYISLNIVFESGRYFFLIYFLVNNLYLCFILDIRKVFHSEANWFGMLVHYLLLSFHLC